MVVDQTLHEGGNVSDETMVKDMKSVQTARTAYGMDTPGRNFHERHSQDQADQTLRTLPLSLTDAAHSI